MNVPSDTPDFAAPAEDLVFSKPSLDDVREALSAAHEQQTNSVSATLVYGLSDLSATDWPAVAGEWQRLPPTTKHRVLRALNEASEALFELNYSFIGLRSLQDSSAMVRQAGIELLWTDESIETMRCLIKRAEADADVAVRSAALKALGRFILLGEYGDMPEAITLRAQHLAMKLHTDLREPLDVRRRALEALANSSHPEVNRLVHAAYADGNHDLRISAIFAMGRTCSKTWRDILLRELQSDDNEILYEAVTACGQIQLEDGLRRIGELTLSEDRELQLAAIWALGEIGGKQAIEILVGLEEATDEEETGLVIGEALDTAGFGQSLASLDFDVDV